MMHNVRVVGVVSLKHFYNDLRVVIPAKAGIQIETAGFLLPEPVRPCPWHGQGIGLDTP